MQTPHNATDAAPLTSSVNMEIDTHAHSMHGGLLRHRLFPRAMAWSAHQAHAPMAPRYEEREDAYEAPRASAYAYEERYAKTAKYDARSSPSSGYRAAPPAGYAGYAREPVTDGREKLFRTIGKYLDSRAPHEEYARGPASIPHPQAPAYDHYTEYAAPPHHHYHHHREAPRAAVPGYDMVKLHRSLSPSAMSNASTRSMSISSHPSPTHSSSSASGSNSRKRQRGPTGSTVPSTGVARPGMSTSSAKRCSVQDCGKIAVSKGLCRGHGGGRRCTFAGCTKCAQSRSPFCWAHGGGKRCEAPNCRRSRKTKRFCVDHVEMEHTVPFSTDSDDSGDHHSHTASSDTETYAPVAAASSLAALHLPSLTDALKRAVPAAVARASAQTVSLPQSRDRLWPVQPAFH